MQWTRLVVFIAKTASHILQFGKLCQVWHSDKQYFQRVEICYGCFLGTFLDLELLVLVKYRELQSLIWKFDLMKSSELAKSIRIIINSLARISNRDSFCFHHRKSSSFLPLSCQNHVRDNALLEIYVSWFTHTGCSAMMTSLSRRVGCNWAEYWIQILDTSKQFGVRDWKNEGDSLVDFHQRALGLGIYWCSHRSPSLISLGWNVHWKYQKVFVFVL